MRRGIVISSLIVASVSLSTTSALSSTQVKSAFFKSFSTHGQRPGSITAGADGNLWFLAGDHTIVKMTTAGKMTPYTLPDSNSDPIDLAPGPDGNVWFTEYSNQKIGMITPTGVVTEFPTGTSGLQSSLTTGPDGNIWFTLSSLAKVGRMTPAGVTTLFWAGVDYPGDITAGSDGNLWFVADSKTGRASTIRMTTAGQITLTVPTLSYPSTLDNIASGPDGNLWLTGTGSSGDFIGKVTSSGTMTEYPISQGTQGITAGSDGALWFGTDLDELGRITTSGVVTTYPVHALTFGLITSGPDGNIWFTDTLNDRVWVRRIT